MANLEEMDPGYRSWVEKYDWKRIDPLPQVKEPPQPENSRLALISSAGFVLPGQADFRQHKIGGDWSFRRLPVDLDPTKLMNSHRSKAFDHQALDEDTELGLPVTLLKELEKQGKIGELHHTAYSFMGSITRPRKLMQKSAPEVADELLKAHVDLALLVPV